MVTPFRLHHDEQHTLPWRLMQDGPVTKYVGREGFDEDLAEMQARGFRIVRFDVSSWPNEDEMYRALADGFGLQSGSSRSFDALYEALTAIDVPEQGGVVVALDNLVETPRMDTLLDVLARASRWWLLFGRLLIIVLRTDDPDYDGPSDLGAVPSQWNWREWFDPNRKPQP